MSVSETETEDDDLLDYVGDAAGFLFGHDLLEPERHRKYEPSWGYAEVDRYEWDASLHPRGKPKNAGQFRLKGEHATTKPDTFNQSLKAVYSEKDAQEFIRLQGEWSNVNDKLLGQIDTPDSPAAKAAAEKLKVIVKQMYRLNADPGGLAGIGKPGGTRDIVIVGTGPGGLTAAIAAGSDGLDTLLIDAQDKPGGQSKYSTRIENYPGFPIGVTGAKLAQMSFEQAQRMGAETKMGVRVTDMSFDKDTGIKTLTLSNGEEIKSRAVVIAGGLEFRQANFTGADRPDVVYGDAEKLAAITKGQNVVIVGGSNGASQAALGIAKTAKHVYLLSRSPISKGMSNYQVQSIRRRANITVVTGECDKHGQGWLITKDGQKIPCAAVGIFIGGAPDIKWLKGIELKNGRVAVDRELQTNIQGVFAVGDIRDGAGGRIGMAVGDGQMAERNTFQYFSKLKQQAAEGQAQA